MKRLYKIAFLILTAGILGMNQAAYATDPKDGKHPVAAQYDEDSAFIAENYQKEAYQIPMRDGVKLYTVVYTPKDNREKLPIMLHRTPYRVAPYEPGKMKKMLGPSIEYAREKFIFVYQDVRGKFMSEGEFRNMRPHRSRKLNRSKDIDESTDTFDTIKWLMRNIKGHNGKVGMWGISYPGFYTVAGAIDAHPSLVAISPQAPIADWFFDDFHHHGAFFLPHTFNFMSFFDQPRKKLGTTWGPRFDHGTPDGYSFFMNMGPLRNSTSVHLGNDLEFWNAIMEHPNYDGFWQARNILPHLKTIKPAVLTVGGWYDAEDLYGPLNIYQTIEKNSPRKYNGIVMGPWVHGGWSRTDGKTLGDVYFGDDSPSDFFLNNIELPFFMHHLKGKQNPGLAEAYMFQTGANKWRTFDTWPPQNRFMRKLYLHSNNGLGFLEDPNFNDEYEEFTSDPNSPVPYTQEITIGMAKKYMVEDQRFAARRPDVLYFQTEPLDQDITIAGGIAANLFVSTSATAADWVVKLIDVYPPDHPANPHQPDKPLGEYQQMVRSEVIRGRFRNSYEKPEPFTPFEVAEINLPMQDVLHTFKKGHRIMVQIQSTWFPLVDRNPQSYVENIFKDANKEDFIKAIHRVYHSPLYPSRLEFGTID